VKLATCGHVCLDLVHTHNSLPKPGGKAQAQSTHVSLGGGAAIAAGEIRRLGGDVDVFTVLGDPGELVTQGTVNLLRGLGVGLDNLNFAPGVTPSMSQVWMDHQDERTISSYQDPRLVSFVPTVMVDPNSSVILFDNYRWPLNLEVIRQTQEDQTLILDVDAPLDSTSWSHMSHFDQIWFSWETFQPLDLSLTEIRRRTDADIVGVTRGSRPITWTDRSDGIYTHKVKKVPGATLGAGDVWRGALAYNLACGMDTPSSIEQACHRAGVYLRGNLLSGLLIPESE
jgi:sugar/nucleoside kinase (ribokinase family)